PRHQPGEDDLTTIPLHHFLAVGAILFALGAIGFLARRNLIVMFLCAEMMLQGVVLNLVAFARYRGNLAGQAFTLFILTVAACEAGVALALILMLFRRSHSLDVSIWQDLREPGQEATTDEGEEPLPPPEPAEGPAHGKPPEVRAYYSWIPVEAPPGSPERSLEIGFQLRADPLTAMMLVMIAFVGSFIAVYSIGYMHGDEGYARFFAE